MKNTKRIFSLFVALIMVFCALPTFVFANDTVGETTGGDKEYEIVVHNGYALDSEGNEIASAAPGEEITLVPYDYTGVREFEGWEIWYGYLGEDFDDTVGEQTVIMTDEYLEIEAYYPDGMLESFNFYLYGYFAGASVNTLYPEAPFGTDMVSNDTGLYSIYENIDGDIGQALYDGDIREGESYWLALTIAASEVVYFGKLLPENITLTFDDGKVINATYAEFTNATTSDMVTVTFELPAAYVRDDLINVSVEGGWALVNGYGIEKTVPGMPVYISADNGPEGQVFTEWKRIEGDIDIADPYNTNTVFIAGVEDVAIEAIFCPRGGITSVSVEGIDAPVVDGNADFAVSVPENSGYTVHEVNWKLVDVSSENYVYLGENYTYTNGNVYAVEVVLKADEGQYFSCHKEGDYAGEAYADGEAVDVEVYEGQSTYEYISVNNYYVLNTDDTEKLELSYIDFDLANYYTGRTPDTMSITSNIPGMTYAAMHNGDFAIKEPTGYGGWMEQSGSALEDKRYRIEVECIVPDEYSIESLRAIDVSLNWFVCKEFWKDVESNTVFAAFEIIPPQNEETYTVWGEVVFDGYTKWAETQDEVWLNYDCYNYFVVEAYEQSEPEKPVFRFSPERDGSFKKYLHDGDYILKTTLKTTKTTDEFGKTTLKTTKTTLELGKTTRINGKTTLDIGKTTLENLKTTKTTIDGGKTTLDLGKTTLDEFVVADLKTTLKTTKTTDGSKTTGPEKTTKTTLKLRRLGDINGDIDINQYDYILAKRVYFNTFNADELSGLAGDINKDSKVNQYDYILVKRHYFETYTIGTRGKTTDDGKTTLDDGKTTIPVK